ncbi:hypothetical protein [Rhodohalobacter mucosus]|uniref:Uncharacterized protein n=1 Tax=Rhodohalobacter mucosus TaxID=2079485 RepID=A0A316U0R9_9BACT|nr:hypothetical protein [Rhodohalobacter mucosus]PWN06356.1 hypothetical protein DDZ15_11080 [Rhodohalobacter mucosus]
MGMQKIEWRGINYLHAVPQGQKKHDLRLEIGDICSQIFTDKVRATAQLINRQSEEQTNRGTEEVKETGDRKNG